jgi:FkbM family methyltransferase
MRFAKARILFRQFNRGRALRLVWAEWQRKLFDRHSVGSYSETGEDRMIGHYLRDVGFYVDVGCNHPERYSNTFALYKRGWKGITIDANQELMAEHRRIRKRDQGICAVVSNRSEEVVFTEFEDSLVSSLNAEHVEKWVGKSKIRRTLTVVPETLTSILDRCQAPKVFDLLSIDVERHDYEVLSSLNFAVYRPKLVVVEMHGFEILNPGPNKIYEHLRENNYQLVGFVSKNGYFRDSS